MDFFDNPFWFFHPLIAGPLLLVVTFGGVYQLTR